jgi:AcrR family transcriptional regulator
VATPDRPVQSVAVPKTVLKNPKATIRAEATKLFARNGYHATGIDEISRAVGLGKGALYHHIGSKEELLFEISGLGLDELMDASQRIVDQDLPWAQKLRALTRVHVDNLVENRDAITVYLREVDLMSKKYRSRLVRRRHRYEDLWVKVLEEGVAAGEFRPIDPAIVKGILGMYNYGYLWLREDGRLAPEAIADLFSSLLLDGLRPA